MRNIIISAAEIFFFSIAAWAQPDFQSQNADSRANNGLPKLSKKKEVGFIIGTNLTEIRTGIPHEGYEVQLGATAGGFIMYKLNRFLFVQPELCFSWKRAKAENLMSGIYQTGPIKGGIVYFELPILMGICIPISSSITPIAHLGPVFDYNFHAYYEYAGVTKTSYDLNELDMGLVVGAGVQICLGIGSLIINARYSYGLLPIYEDEHQSDWKSYSDVFSIGLGYAHPF